MDQATQARTEESGSCCSAVGDASGSGAGCPMASMFQDSVGSSKFGIFLLIPGIVLLGVGVLVLLMPALIKWLLAGTSILLGIALLGMAISLRRLSSRIQKH